MNFIITKNSYFIIVSSFEGLNGTTYDSEVA